MYASITTFIVPSFTSRRAPSVPRTPWPLPPPLFSPWLPPRKSVLAFPCVRWWRPGRLPPNGTPAPRPAEEMIYRRLYHSTFSFMKEGLLGTRQTPCPGINTKLLMSSLTMDFECTLPHEILCASQVLLWRHEIYFFAPCLVTRKVFMHRSETCTRSCSHWRSINHMFVSTLLWAYAYQRV